MNRWRLRPDLPRTHIFEPHFYMPCGFLWLQRRVA